MSDFKIASQISGQGAITGQKSQLGGKSSADPGAFAQAVDDAMGKVNTIHNDAERAVMDLTRGGDITNTILAVEKADMSFQVMLEVRNKLVSAYEEVMRIQV